MVMRHGCTKTDAKCPLPVTAGAASVDAGDLPRRPRRSRSRRSGSPTNSTTTFQITSTMEPSKFAPYDPDAPGAALDPAFAALVDPVAAAATTVEAASAAPQFTYPDNPAHYGLDAAALKGPAAAAVAAVPDATTVAAVSMTAPEPAAAAVVEPVPVAAATLPAGAVVTEAGK